MAIPQTSPSQQQSSAPAPRTETPPWLHNSAIVAAVLGPIALLMPPRRVGFQAMLLSGGTFWATNLLMYDWTGESVSQRFSRRWNNLVNGDLPEKARRTQELLRLERERREAALPEAQRKALQEERERKAAASRGPLARLWMGNEKENWKEERAKKEKEALEEGRGYGDLIMDQVREAFSKEKKADDQKEDEKCGDEKK